METPIEQAVAILRRNQFKITKQRQALLDYLVTYQDHYVAISAVDEHADLICRNESQYHLSQY